jgi:hypothetical protein
VIFFISSTAAPIFEVATPIFLGNSGNGFLGALITYALVKSFA